jgi:nucleoside-diphosphate-sugar epimerase
MYAHDILIGHSSEESYTPRSTAQQWVGFAIFLKVAQECFKHMFHVSKPFILEFYMELNHTLSEYFVDVVDIARLHTAALLDPNTVSQRIFGFAEPLNLTEMVAILRKLRPDNAQIPDAPADGHDLTNVLPARKAEKLLQDFYGKSGWTTAEESIATGLEGW